MSSTAVDNNHTTNDESLQQVVELSLVDLTIDIRDDISGTNILVLVVDVLDSVGCNTAEACLSPLPLRRGMFWGGNRGGSQHKKEQQEVANRIQQQVVRFIKVPDKYISFTSILLKSQAFQLTHPQQQQQQEQEKNSTAASPLPVVEIPRTQYKKPYIPSASKHKYDSFPEVNLFPLSISHQFPFVGRARLLVDTQLADGDANANGSAIIIEPRNRPLVGLDIVTFDDYNHKFYGSLADFVGVFESNFTVWEWSCIQDPAVIEEGAMLQEFYLRWAIKEAYTKALGVGMGLPFDSFETRLEYTSSSGGGENKNQEGIYSWLKQQPFPDPHDHNGSESTNMQPILLPGSVILNPGTPEAKSEACAFFFVPLWDHETWGVGRSLNNARGCACVCLLQPSGQDSYEKISLTTKWQSLDDLVNWHRH